MVKQDGVIYALSTICTHLGCIPNWTPSSLTFECPCHGSGYYSSGINFKGPAPRPLERFEIKRDTSGELLVNKGRVFRQEKGQWNPPGFLCRECLSSNKFHNLYSFTKQFFTEVP